MTSTRGISKKGDEDPVVSELSAIKRLLALMLVTQGVPKQTVAKAAKVRASTVVKLTRGVSRNQNGERN